MFYEAITTDQIGRIPVLNNDADFTSPKSNHQVAKDFAKEKPEITMKSQSLLRQVYGSMLKLVHA